MPTIHLYILFVNHYCNTVLIETVNAKKLSFTLGHNEFSDMTHTEFKKRMGLGEFAPELINREGKVFNFMEYNEEEEDEEEEELSNSRLRGGVVADEAVVERKLQGPVPINPANTPTATDKDEKDWHELGLMGPIRQQVSLIVEVWGGLFWTRLVLT